MKLLRSIFCVIGLIFTQIAILLALFFQSKTNNYSYSERWIMESSHFGVKEEDEDFITFTAEITGKPTFFGALKQELSLIWNS